MSHRPVPSHLLATCFRPANLPGGQRRHCFPRSAVVISFLLLAFLFLAVAGGCKGQQPHGSAPGDRHASAIQEVLKQDQAATDRCKQGWKADRLGAIRAYVQALRHIDLRPCPPDFQEAFLKHRYAWEEMVPFLEKYDGFTGDLTKVFELGSALYKDLSLTTEGDRQFEQVRKGITATYFDIEKSALRYGVQPEHGWLAAYASGGAEPTPAPS